MNLIHTQFWFTSITWQRVAGYFSVFIYIFLFFIARYPFYRYLPVPLPIVADGTEYYQIYKHIISGLPRFYIITPTYPLFISFIHEFFSEKAIALYVGQSFVTFFSGILLISSVFKYYKKCAPFVCLALAIFLNQDATLRFETASFPQSLMISLSFAFIAFLIGVLNRPNWFNAVIMSACVVFLVLLKSSQIFFLPILTLIIIYLALIRRKQISLLIVVCCSLPLLTYAGYNYFTIKQFTIISIGGLEEAAKQKVFDNTAQNFFYKVGAELPQWHPVYKIHHSADLDTLQQAYLTARWGTTLKKDTLRHVLNMEVIYEMKETVNVDSVVLNNNAFTQTERVWYLSQKDSLEGIIINFYPRGWKMHKDYVLNYFLNSRRKAPSFYYSEIQWRYENFFITRAWAQRYDLNNQRVKERLSFLLRELYMPAPGSMAQFQIQYNKMTSDFFFKLYDFYNLKAGRMLARNIVWLYTYFFLAIITILLFVTRFRNPHLFFLFLLVLIHLGSCLIHAIWGDPLNRYSHATEFIPFLLLAFCPLLFMKKK